MRDESDIAAEKRAQDFVDLQHELRGEDIGRLRRFLSPDDVRAPEAQRKKRARDALRRQLVELLLDPAYRALYTAVGTRLSEAEVQADRAIVRVEAQLLDAVQAIEEMENAAARGPDGQPVFRYADGRVVTADGEELPPEIAAGIVWPPHAPSAEAYFAERARHDALEAQLGVSRLTLQRGFHRLGLALRDDGLVTPRDAQKGPLQPLRAGLQRGNPARPLRFEQRLTLSALFGDQPLAPRVLVRIGDTLAHRLEAVRARLGRVDIGQFLNSTETD